MTNAEAYSQLIKLAAQMARGDGLMSSFYEDHKWYKSTPMAERRRIVREAETVDSMCKDWAMGVKAAADALWREVDDMQRLPQPLRGFVPQTYGDAIQAGWIKHGDCSPHEWDNRTSAANARWVLKRLMTARETEAKP